jgi:hypothetical protein
MGSIVKSISAVIAGFVVASIVMLIVESINGHVLYPDMAKAAEGMKDRDALRALFASAPVGALLVVIFGWILGSFAGGWTAARIAPSATIKHGLIVGGLLTLAGIANNLMLPPPLWFWCLSLVVFLPSSYAGARLAPVR